MKTVLSIAVVGLGYWGPNLARVFSQLPGCRLAGLCDKDPERLNQMRRLYPDVTRFSDLSSMLRKTNPDAVVIAAPARQHFPLAKEALLAGKHVFIEKPMATSTGECRDLIQMASARNLTLMVGHIFLYSAAIRLIQVMIAAGQLGEIRYINSQRLNLGLFRNDINVVWDLAPHDISIVLSLLGRPPVSVNCQGNASVTRGVEDVANLSMNFGANRFVTIQTSWLEPKKIRRMTIVGTDRMIVYDDIEPHEKIRIFDMRVEPPPHYDNFGDFQYCYHYGDCHIPHIEQEEPLRGMCRHFLDCINHGTAPLTGGEMGLDVVRILEACSMSLHANGGAVLVPSQPAEPVPPLGLLQPIPASCAC
jgi:predicted dehydrogenase